MPDPSEPVSKRRKTRSVDQEPLDRFMTWANDQGIHLSDKVCGSAVNVAANYGMIAKFDIKEGETIFVIPRKAILSVDNCSISNLLKANEEVLESPSGWVSLILALVYEKTNPESRWRPYLDAFPNFDDVELPMFWPVDEMTEELEGTRMAESVMKDVNKMKSEFTDIALPFIKSHPDVFVDSKCTEFDLYKRMAAFIMSYSFTDDASADDVSSDSDGEEERHFKRPTTIMVPMADLLNHVPDHNAELQFGETVVSMVAVKDIAKGEEIFNTYGPVSNYTLLLMYGFAVRPELNPHNTVDLELSYIKWSCDELDWPADRVERWKLLSTLEVAETDGICVHSTGLSDDIHIIKVLLLEHDAVRSKLEEDEGWMSDDEDETEYPFETLAEFDAQIKSVLSMAANQMLLHLPDDWESAINSSTSNRSFYSKCVQGSSVLLLNKLKQALKKQ